MMMSRLPMLLVALLVTLPAGAQEVQRSSHPQGMQVQGSAELKAHQETSAAVAVGDANSVRNSAAAVRSGTQIQGNTKVKAEQKNATATAVGRNNAASNEVGVIGGK